MGKLSQKYAFAQAAEKATKSNSNKKVAVKKSSKKK